MPRKPRVDLIGIPDRVVQRGNSRERWFFGEGELRTRLNALRG